MPIGAEQTATGYEVAWKVSGANQYTVWNTDSNGNYLSNIGVVSGTSYALESLETSFHQDLNGDGTIGLTAPTVIESAGSTSLTQVADQFYLDNSGGSGPALKYGGAAWVVGQSGGWMPIGAEQTATGYEVAWKLTGANQYTVWNTDSNGNYLSNIGVVSGTSTALKSLEPSFYQDLNGDGVIGQPTTAIEVTGKTSLTVSPFTQGATIDAGATLELAGADSGSVTFKSATGELVLDHSTTFSGQISNFTGDGTLSGSDQIDLKDINYNSVQDSYANGVLTITDGTDTAKLNFNGSYTQANFHLASDGSGGTIVYDPPVPTPTAPTSGTAGSATIGNGETLALGAAFSGSVTFDGPAGTLVLDSASNAQPLDPAVTVSGFGAQDTIDLTDLAFGAQTTLGYSPNSNQTGGTLTIGDGSHAASIALLGNYIASSFAIAGDNNGGTMVVAEMSQSGGQPLLTNPQHA